MNYKLEKIISNKEFLARTAEIQKQIEKDYKEYEEIIFISILNGASYFTTFLTSGIQLKKPVIEFIKVSSYGEDMFSQGRVNFKTTIDFDIKDKNVILIDDVLDTGLTLSKIKEELLSLNPKSLKVCVLIEKEGTNTHNIKADYVGFLLPNVFLVGCGLDWANQYRTLKYIAKIIKEE